MVSTPNVQPIFPVKPFVWNVKLSNQVAGRDPSNGNNIITPPALLGRAGEAGCMIDSLQINSAVFPVDPGGGGSLGGGPVPPGFVDATDPDIGPHGFGLGPGTEYLKTINFYFKLPQSTNLVWFGQIALPADTPNLSYRWGYPILPDPQLGVRMAPGEEIYLAMALQNQIGTDTVPGLVVSVRGGHYSLDGESFAV